MADNKINPESVSPPLGGYSHGLELATPGRLLLISGQIPERQDGTVPDDFDGQCAQIWENIGKVLEASGMGFGDLVQVRTYLTDRAQAEANGEIRRRYLRDHRPSLTVVVAQTLQAEWLLEIEALAFRSS